MARLRVSSGTVWRRAGGRRGPEPALALDSAELGLSWEDADAPASSDPQPPVTLGAPVRRRYAAAVYALSLAFVPLVVATATASAPAEQGGESARRGEVRQYQALVGPVVVPAAGETITLDKWKGTSPDRLQPRPRRPQPAGVAPIVVPDVTTPAPVLSWAGTFPASQRLPARSLPLGGTVLVTPQAPPSVDLSWLPQETPRHRRPAFVGGQAWVAPLSVPDVTQPAPPLSWAARVSPQPVQRRRAPYPLTAPPVEVTPPPPLPPLTWLVPQTLGRMPKDGPAIQYSPVTGPVLELDHGWQPQAPVAPPRRLPVRVGGSVGIIEPIAPPPPETATAPAHQGGDVARAGETRQYQAVTGPVLVPAPAAVVVDGWLHTTRPGPIRRPSRPIVAGASVVAPPAPPAATPTGWLVPQTVGRMPKDGPAIQYAPVTGPVEVAPDFGWWPREQAPRRLPPARVAARTAVVAPVTVPTAAATPFGWWQQPPRPPLRPRRPAGQGTAPPAVIVPPGPGGLEWRPVYPAFVPARRQPVERGRVAYPFVWPDAVVIVPEGNLWEDISDTPGSGPFGAGAADTGTSPFGPPPASAGASPFGTGAADTGTSPFGAPPTPSGRSPWDPPA